MTIKEDRHFQSRLLFGSDKLNLSFDLRTFSLCPSLRKGDRTIPMVVMGKRHRLLGCFLGNLEIGYSSTSVGPLPSDFKLPSFPRIGNIFVDARVRIAVTESKDHSSKIRNMAHKYQTYKKYWIFENLRSEFLLKRTFFMLQKLV